MDRLQVELELVRQHYPDAEIGASGGWLLIPSFPLPAGYNRPQTRLLVLIPPGYPQTPPDNFFVESGLRLASGGTPANYSDPVSIAGGTWAQFSWHAEAATWRPMPDPRAGHNLVTFLNSVRDRLMEVQ